MFASRWTPRGLLRVGREGCSGIRPTLYTNLSRNPTDALLDPPRRRGHTDLFSTPAISYPISLNDSCGLPKQQNDRRARGRYADMLTLPENETIASSVREQTNKTSSAVSFFVLFFFCLFHLLGRQKPMPPFDLPRRYARDRKSVV